MTIDETSQPAAGGRHRRVRPWRAATTAVPARSRRATIVLTLMFAALAVGAFQLSADAATPSPSVVCPLAVQAGPIATIPRCPPPCPLPSPATTPTAGAAEGPPATVDGSAAPAIWCPPPIPTSIPIDGFAITGVTENQLCAGPTLPTGCTSPFRPASDKVTIIRDGVLVAAVTSDNAGKFRVPVGPGTYVASARPSLVGVAADCPAQTVVVSGPPVPTVITLRCSIQLP